MSPLLTDTNIEVGNHFTTKIGPISLNIDTIGATIFAGLVVIALGLALRRQVTHQTPGKLQLFWEVITDYVQKQVDSSIGPTAPFVVPLAITLFVFILVANWVELIPSGVKREYLPAPTADVNLPFAMAITVIIWVHITAIRKKGAREYFSHYAQPNKIMIPINVIEEIVKPITLALRLFGNIFAGGIMLALIALFPFYLLWVPNIAWKLFDAGIGLIQAFIFMLLTILYFSFALSGHGDEGHEAGSHADSTSPATAG